MHFQRPSYFVPRRVGERRVAAAHHNNRARARIQYDIGAALKS
jgi:hypothetical protein